jgi:hypothetical protein
LGVLQRFSLFCTQYIIKKELFANYSSIPKEIRLETKNKNTTLRKCNVEAQLDANTMDFQIFKPKFFWRGNNDKI